MTQAAIYLATAPKSNTALTDLRGGQGATSTRTARCRCPRTSATRRRRSIKELGYGAGYQYPHDFEGHYVREDYLPDALRGHRYYEPSDSGQERNIAERLARLRGDAQDKATKP